jgi:hypothetical protein
MFGETEYDPIRQFGSVGIEEQLGALGGAVDAGKVSNDNHQFYLSHQSLDNIALTVIMENFVCRSDTLVSVMKHHMVS